MRKGVAHTHLAIGSANREPGGAGKLLGSAGIGEAAGLEQLLARADRRPTGTRETRQVLHLLGRHTDQVARRLRAAAASRLHEHVDRLLDGAAVAHPLAADVDRMLAAAQAKANAILQAETKHREQSATGISAAERALWRRARTCGGKCASK